MAGDTSRENGKLGGRPKGMVALEAEKARQLIVQKVAENMPAIISVLLEKAIVDKDIAAIKELFDRGFGKPAQSVEFKGQVMAVNLTPEVLKLASDYEEKLKENAGLPDS